MLLGTVNTTLNVHGYNISVLKVNGNTTNGYTVFTESGTLLGYVPFSCESFPITSFTRGHFVRVIIPTIEKRLGVSLVSMVSERFKNRVVTAIKDTKPTARERMESLGLTLISLKG